MSRGTVRIFLTGDVMLGRGIDQVLAHPCKPHLYESYVKDARVYVQIAERRNGKLPSRQITSQSDYIWGDLIKAFKIYSPDIKLINLETSITTCEDYWPSKGINYRMNPANIYSLHAISTKIKPQITDEKDNVDIKQETSTSKPSICNNLVCNLANNHVLDFGYDGLNETLLTLRNENILFCGAGENALSAWKPTVIEIADKKCRIFIFGVGSDSSGCPKAWNATNKKGGIARIDPYNSKHIPLIMENIKTNVFEYTKNKKQDTFKNIIILSIHWGPNWGFDINKHFIKFAHGLIDYTDKECNNLNIEMDLIHGHSSHHIKGFEIYKNKVIFYGCGDFLSDYEGITGNPQHDCFNDDLSFMYFVDLDSQSGNVEDIILKGSKLKNFQIHYAKNKELNWLHTTIKEQAAKFGVKFHESKNDQTLRLKPSNPCKHDDQISKLDDNII